MPRNAIRGLSNFIGDVRACPSKDAEEGRVQKELAKLRQRVTDLTTGYERKKCVWKLVYISMLGYRVPFGHMEAVNLLGSQVYSEKACGYIASVLLLSHEPLIINLATNTACLDIRGYQRNETFTCLALNFVANGATAEMASQLWQAVTTAMLDSQAPVLVRKKAYLAALRLVRVLPELMPPDPWCDKIFGALLQEHEAASSLVIFILGVLELQSPEPWYPLLEPCYKLFCKISDSSLSELMYVSVPAPWARVKLLRIFQFFRPPQVYPRLLENLSTLINTGPFLPRCQSNSSKRKNKVEQEKLTRSHVEHAVYLEAVNLLVAWERIMPQRLRKTAALALGATTYMKDANLRCMRLESLCGLAKDPDVAQLLQKQMNVITNQLAEVDVGVQRQSVQLLAALTDGGNWRAVVDKLITSLPLLQDKLLREETVLTIFVLIEKFAPDVAASYAGALFDLAQDTSDSITDAVRHRGILLLLSGSKTSQANAVRRAFEALADSYCPENLVEWSGYILGEFGSTFSEIAPSRQVALLAKHLHRSVAQRTLLLALAKLAASFPKLTSKVSELLEHCWSHSDVEIQTRAVELHALLQQKRCTVIATLAEMPPIPPLKLVRTQLVERLKIGRSRAVCRPRLEIAAVTEGGLLPPATLENLGHSKALDGDMNSLLGRLLENEPDLATDALSSNDIDDNTSSEAWSSDTEDLNLPPPTGPKDLWLYTRLMGAGTLLSTPSVNITVRFATRGCRCRVAIEISSATLHSAQCSVSLLPSQALHLRLLSAPSGPLPLKVAIEAQLQVLAAFTPPQIAVAFAGQQVVVSLPIQLSSFLTGTKISTAHFQRYWNGAGKEQVSRFVGTALRHATTLSMVRPILSQGFGFSVHHEADNSLRGSASLTNQYGGIEQQCACLVKVELHGKQMSIAVRANNSEATKALLAEIAACICEYSV